LERDVKNQQNHGTSDDAREGRNFMQIELMHPQPFFVVLGVIRHDSAPERRGHRPWAKSTKPSRSVVSVVARGRFIAVSRDGNA
jgi:hypothetical protein